MRRFVDHLDTPLGRLCVVVDETEALSAVGFETEHDRMQRLVENDWIASSDPAGATTALARYFAGELSALDGLRVRARGTEFQERVWAALREIPCGVTWSYGRLAAHIGNPRAVRAVGLANGANPVALVVPCHRVIGADGSLTGYGAGIERKRWLLQHEGVPVGSARAARRAGV